jgi:hypothetical protein
MYSFLFLIISLIIFFPNSLFFTVSLLIISVTSLCFLFYNGVLGALTCLMVSIVYVGAIMILIGYVCAVRPNLKLEPDFSIFFPLLFSFFLVLALTSLSNTFVFNLRYSLSEFIYSSPGLRLFITVIFILLLTLLIVTSQFTLPRGPFRSV